MNILLALYLLSFLCWMKLNIVRIYLGNPVVKKNQKTNIYTNFRTA